MIILLGTLFMACQEDIACTAEFVYSSTINLTDQDGIPVNEADVSYTVNDEDGLHQVESAPGGGFLVGGEEAGDFVVEIEVRIEQENDPCCWEAGSTTVEYTVEADECHVIPEIIDAEIELVLVCSDDTDECG